MRLSQMTPRLAVLVGALVLLSGCGSPTSSPTTTEPPSGSIVSPDAPSEATDIVAEVIPFPDEEWADFTVRCIRAAGFEAERVTDFAVASPDLGLEMNKILDEVSKRCHNTATEFGLYESWDVDTLAAREDFYNKSLEITECLIENGYKVPKPPSLEVFMEAESLWDAYGSLSIPQVREAEKICPESFFNRSDARYDG